MKSQKSTRNLMLKKIGFVSKLNGYNGEVVLAADGDDFLDEDFLFLEMEGLPVPFFVEDIFEKGGNIILKLENVDDEEHAQQLVRHDVFIEQKKNKKRDEDFHYD